MEYDGLNFDLQAQLFADRTCEGCWFADKPCCLELVGAECARRGKHWIWVLVDE